MKMASFEKAMGAAAQFLGYLGEMSALKYQPEFATWQAQQTATLYQWQAKMDIYKMKIAQAYQQSNIKLAGQIAAEAAATQQGYNIELAKMDIEASKQQAIYSGAGSLFGTTIGWIFG